MTETGEANTGQASENTTKETVKDKDKFETDQHTTMSTKHPNFGQSASCNHVLFLVAIVTICQGMCFIAVSFLDSSVPFLPHDPLTLIGVMYTVMGLGFVAVSCFYKSSKVKAAATERRNCMCHAAQGLGNPLSENTKKTD